MHVILSPLHSSVPAAPLVSSITTHAICPKDVNFFVDHFNIDYLHSLHLSPSRFAGLKADGDPYDGWTDVYDLLNSQVGQNIRHLGYTFADDFGEYYGSRRAHSHG